MSPDRKRRETKGEMVPSQVGPSKAISTKSSAAGSDANSDLFVKGCFESMKIFQDTVGQDQIPSVVGPDVSTATAGERPQINPSALWMAESELMKVVILYISFCHGISNFLSHANNFST